MSLNRSEIIEERVLLKQRIASLAASLEMLEKDALAENMGLIDLYHQQLQAMNKYSRILKLRIDLVGAGKVDFSKAAPPVDYAEQLPEKSWLTRFLDKFR